jgi:hypothetical protein
MKKNLQLYFLYLLAAWCCSGCKKLIEVKLPEDKLITSSVFSDSTTAKAALLNIYALYAAQGTYNPYIGLYSDELGFSSSTAQALEFLRSAVTVTNSADLSIWKNYYLTIYSCNDLIIQLNKNSKLPPALARQLTGEAKFLRAYTYFYLVNMYGAVPLVLQTDVNVTAVASRADSAAVYNQIKADLADAESNLSANYQGDGKVRATALAATALSARVALYQRDWARAEAAATKVIGSGLFTPLEAPANVFLANSRESILQFASQNGFVATNTVMVPASGRPTYPLTNVLVNAFEPGDLRKSAWTKSALVSNVAYYYVYKYHNRTANTASPENLVALRAGEQYLIRAEARAMQNNLTGAQADLNVIRNRAGLPNTVAATQLALISAILHERQVELFAELGHRFYDLKRTGQANAVLGAYKTTWKTGASLLLPIPQNEIIHDQHLQQNPGY